MTDQPLQTEFEFTLPRGYVDDDGTLHTEGRMRLATAADEIQPLQNPRVQSNSSYLTIVLLSRVVTELGTLETIDEDVIQNLFVTDLEYLQAMYERVNNRGRNATETACPDCGSVFDVDVETGAHLAPPADADVEPPGVNTGADDIEEAHGTDESFDAIGTAVTDGVDDGNDTGNEHEQTEVEAGNPSE
ncbi:hypothetical protein C482_03596 [Natrialba chahannaoensis JCM 10990]|uniref:Phage tail assembly protein n=1 Tax=Natrialba chahannaoensis JCM 10990 TaxID=1227492 RepID=M0AZX7_9EURY|nr:hypothetical protein [Natrialba chahannaoensis]ELZ04085.1 hypothetical protein C482_03596 [Natrialba chahannaoensis JCM 10990]